MGNEVLRCCVPNRSDANLESASGRSWLKGGTNRVELAASELELFAVSGLATAYHTSVLVNGEEFFFSDSGIFNDRALTSHQGSPSERVDLGMSGRTGAQLLHALGPFFRPGTYDLVRKNCNSFSDCALHYLLGRRLENRFAALDRLGQLASPEMLQRMTKGMYHPNPAAAQYKTSEVLAELDRLGEADLAGTSETMPRSKPSLSIGARVTVIGLRNASNLNGQGAQIVYFNPVNGRWEAQVNISGEIKAFRAENLRPAGELVFEPGDKARIHSLKTESGKALNGLTCEILRYLHDVSRYEVRVVDDIKALRAENLQIEAQ